MLPADWRAGGMLGQWFNRDRKSPPLQHAGWGQVFLLALFKRRNYCQVIGLSYTCSTLYILYLLSSIHSESIETYRILLNKHQAVQYKMALKKCGWPLVVLQALYSSPQAQVRLQGHLSQPISIAQGTRQGCPFSLLVRNCDRDLGDSHSGWPRHTRVALVTGTPVCSIRRWSTPICDISDFQT